MEWHSYTGLVFSWLLFFALHSGLAAIPVKRWLTERWPGLLPWYRLGYNLLSALLLAPAGYLYATLPAEPLLNIPPAVRLGGLLLLLAGVYILVAAFRYYRSDEFLGWYQLRHKRDFQAGSLNREGWNRYVRHPLYLATLLIVLGLFVFTPTLKAGLTALLVVLYLYIGARWEEHKLMAEFGEEYSRYRQEVSMLLPWKWLAARFRGKF